MSHVMNVGTIQKAGKKKKLFVQHVTLNEEKTGKKLHSSNGLVI
jgi:hypothetical protein